MTEHEELCPDYGKHHNGMTVTTEHCRCALIAQIRVDLLKELVAAWDRDNHAVRFNHGHHDLSPVGRVRRWLLSGGSDV